MSSIRISGFSDEIAPDIETQFTVLNKLGIKYFEPRGINGTNISKLTYEQATNLYATMNTFGIKCSSIGSPIGKVKLNNNINEHFELFKNVVKIAKILDSRYIRLFSFFRDNDFENWDEKSFDEICKNLDKMINYAAKNDIVLLHENEKGIYGDSADRCLKLMERFYGDNFKAVFDPANFVQFGVDTVDAFKKLKKYIAYVHVKDAFAGDGHVVPAGYGDGNVKYILNELISNGYDGFLSLEPHLGNFEGLGNLENGDIMKGLPEGGEGTFTLAYNSLNKILEEINGGKTDE